MMGGMCIRWAGSGQTCADIGPVLHFAAEKKRGAVSLCDTQ
jgi:hypothetical protein